MAESKTPRTEYWTPDADTVSGMSKTEAGNIGAVYVWHIDHQNIVDRLEAELVAANERAEKAEQERDSARQAACPPSHVCVPVEPTDKMLMCFGHEWITGRARDCYKAMLAAHGGVKP